MYALLLRSHFLLRYLVGLDELDLLRGKLSC